MMENEVENVSKRKACTFMEFCPYANDCEHNRVYSHNGCKQKRDFVFSSDNSVRLVEKSELLPLVKNWKFSSLFPVTGKRGYHFLGWEIQNYKEKSGKIAIYKECDSFYGGRCETYSCDEIDHLMDKRRIFQPWDDNRVSVYFIPKVKKMMDDILGRKIPECNGLSYLDILLFLHKNSIPAFVIGGAVRDCVCSLRDSSINTQKINDVDFTFGTSANHLIHELRNEYGETLPINTSRFGLVVIGPSFSELRMEGKCSNGINTARRRLGSIPRVVGTNLFYDVMGRDFTINSLLYDPVNGTTIDPTARNALYDCFKRKLRICIGKHPVSKTEKKREFWIIGNPLNIQRYHRFVNSGFSPSKSTKEFMLQAEKDWDAQHGRFYVIPDVPTKEELVEKQRDISTESAEDLR